MEGSVPHASSRKRCADLAGSVPLRQISNHTAAKDLITIQQALLRATPGRAGCFASLLGPVLPVRARMAGDLTAHHRGATPNQVGDTRLGQARIHPRHDRRTILNTQHPTTAHDQPPNSITATRKLLTPYDTALYLSSADYEVGCYKLFFDLYGVLSDYVFHSFSQEISGELCRCASLGVGVDSVPMLLTAAWRGGVRCITEICPSDIARCYILLGPGGQEEVKRLFLEFARQGECSDDHLLYLKWVKKIRSALLNEVGAGRMAEVRRKEFIRRLDGILDPPSHIVF